MDRDTVITNRLTQRQSVNVPLMKETRKTLLAGMEEQDIYFENLDNDGQKELLFNEYWKHVAERSRLNILNEIDAKQEFLYGRSFWKLNIISGRLTLEIIDPQDVLVDRYVNPWDLESARRITHTGIYATLSDIERNAMFDKSTHLASPGTSRFPGVEPARIEELERAIDAMERELPPLTNFILPGGAPGAAHLHVARTVCRRAERLVVALGDDTDATRSTIAYLNRLSDYLFVAARFANLRAGVGDVPWRR